MPTLRVLFSGRKELTYDSLKPHCSDYELLHLPETDVYDYLKKLGISDEDLMLAVYKLTDGFSLSVSMVGDLWKEADGKLRAQDLETEEFQTTYRNEMVPELLMRRIRDRAEDRFKPIIEVAGLYQYL